MKYRRNAYQNFIFHCNIFQNNNFTDIKQEQIESMFVRPEDEMIALYNNARNVQLSLLVVHLYKYIFSNDVRGIFFWNKTKLYGKTNGTELHVLS